MTVNNIIQNEPINILLCVICTSLIFFILNLFYIRKFRPFVNKEAEEEKIKTIKKEAKLRLFITIIALLSVATIAMFFAKNSQFTIRDIIKCFAFSFGASSFITISILDVKFGEVFIYELELTNTIGLVLIPIIVNFTINCPCIGKRLLVVLAVYIVLKMLNYLLNRELSIGGADVDTLLAIIGTNVALFSAIQARENMPIFMTTFYFETLLNAMIVNCIIVLVSYFLYTKIIARFIVNKDKSINDKQRDNEESYEINNSNFLQEETKEVKETKESEDEQHLEKEDFGVDNKDNNNGKRKGRKDNKNKANFRCLPCFVMLYIVTLFYVLYY